VAGRRQQDRPAGHRPARDASVGDGPGRGGGPRGHLGRVDRRCARSGAYGLTRPRGRWTRNSGRHVRRPIGEGPVVLRGPGGADVAAASSDEVGTAVLLTQVPQSTKSLGEAHARPGGLVLAQAAAEVTERNGAALARVGQPESSGRIGPGRTAMSKDSTTPWPPSGAFRRALTSNGERAAALTPGSSTAHSTPPPHTRRRAPSGEAGFCTREHPRTRSFASRTGKSSVEKNCGAAHVSPGSPRASFPSRSTRHDRVRRPEEESRCRPRPRSRP